MSTTDSPTNRSTGRYLDELMKELQLMANLYETNHSGKFRNAHNLLVREIQRVLDTEINRGFASGESAPRPDPEPSALELTPISKMMGDESMMSSSRRSSFSPMPSRKWLNMSVSPERIFDDGGSVEKTDKLYFPEDTVKNSNPIGRLIGPRGMTIRQLEKDFACKLFIRGKGCTKDDAKEARLRGKSGWEHLEEPIHVLITTRAETEEQCLEKLGLIKARLQDFLENPDSELKRAQLMQLAVIEGTLK